MLLPHDEAMNFISGYKAVLLEILKFVKAPQSGKITQDLVKARDFIKENPHLLQEAISSTKAKGEQMDCIVENALLTIRIGRWINLRSTTKYALMLDEPQLNAYAVKALTTPLHELAGSRSSIFEAAIFQYKGEFLCDGLVANPVHLGPGIRADLNDVFTKIKENGHFYKRCVA